MKIFHSFRIFLYKYLQSTYIILELLTYVLRPRLRQISIVEEEEEEEDEEEMKDVTTTNTTATGMPLKGLSRHSSTSSLAEIAASGAAGIE